MADEQNQNPDATPNGTPQAAPAPQPVAAPSTQVDIEAIKREAYNAGAAAARRAHEGKAPANPPPPKSEPQPAPQSDPPGTLAILKLRDDFDDATADLSMAAAQKRFLRERVMAERPSDVAGYVRTFAETWGIKTVNPAPAPNGAALPGQAPQPGAPSPPPTPMPAGSPPSKVVTEDTPILALSSADRIDLARRIGPFEFRKRLMGQLAVSGERFRLR